MTKEIHLCRYLPVNDDKYVKYIKFKKCANWHFQVGVKRRFESKMLHFEMKRDHYCHSDDLDGFNFSSNLLIKF